MGTRHELAEVRQIMDILSRLSYSRKDISGLLRDNIHIVVKKQLSSCNINVKRMGIVGAVMVVKNMSKAAPEETSLNT